MIVTMIWSESRDSEKRRRPKVNFWCDKLAPRSKLNPPLFSWDPQRIYPSLLLLQATTKGDIKKQPMKIMKGSSHFHGELEKKVGYKSVYGIQGTKGTPKELKLKLPFLRISRFELLWFHWFLRFLWFLQFLQFHWFLWFQWFHWFHWFFLVL